MRGFILTLALLFALPTFADDKQALQQLLDQFLAGAHLKTQHQRFWTDDLIYTSSSGTRFGKADILAGFKDDTPAEAPDSVYRGEDVDIRLLGDVAVVAFTLVGVTGDSEQRYFNTGTFIKRDGEWRAMAWQATKAQAKDVAGK
ncbi:nuclear transport factor 2 family protein [Simiduia agarivorans]|uniref:DUF4440 domain-containing protein n=1 Tax=Simiduia agarivorans (strain DSM 21679 / JCM 13881 / BCRC 17597 / SA1) TaxID=1117647 RepID=K4KNC4_SIMAS|nr:nuclear transport factor 2 family protein [Simiduia agarivorans]AFV00547.1 hypothetical protein M5M_17080 [Simiduia agarivorans SA1 = DSM 21679]